MLTRPWNGLVAYSFNTHNFNEYTIILALQKLTLIISHMYYIPAKKDVIHAMLQKCTLGSDFF